MNDYTTNESSEETTIEWRDIPGYEGIYQITRDGQIKRILGGSGAVAGRILKQGISDVGYFLVRLSKSGVIKTHNVHRLVMLTFVGKCPDGLVVNHKNGNYLDNHLHNLEYCTQKENIRHAIEVLGVDYSAKIIANRHDNTGERHPQAILNDSKVIRIREMYSSGMKMLDIARLFGVSYSTIQAITSRRLWKHVK